MKRAFILVMIAILLIASSIAVFGTEKNIDVDKDTYKIGEKIIVNYEGTTEKDWVGIFYKGATPGSSVNSIEWEYAPDGDGQIEFEVTLSAGEYDIILLENDGYNVLLRKTITVENDASIVPDMELSKSSYTRGEKIVINYTGSTGTGWIGIYNKGTQPKDEDGYKSLYWKFTKDVSQPNGTMEFNVDLPIGEYDAILFEDEGYIIMERITFSVVNPNYDKPSDPESIQYNRKSTKRGMADGTITIKATDTSSLTGYAVFFANSDGVLKGYAPIVVSKGTGNTATYNFPSNTFIPTGATKLVAFSLNGNKLSDNSVSVELPANSDLLPGSLLYSFQVISDLHLRADSTNLYNRHFDMALKDIKKTAPQSKGILVAGDITDTGLQSQYDQLKSIVEANKANLPAIYYAMGNHEFQNSSLTWSQEVELFKTNTNTPALYYDFKINGNYFIVLGSEKEGLNANIGTEQLKWLDGKLKEAIKNSTGPIFIINHQPLKNTVSGSLPGQGWDGVDQDAMVRNLLDKYPRAIMFSGHTHWELTSKSPMFDGGTEGATFFNTASVGYLWTDAQQNKDGSQGLYVEVYKDMLVVKGRDFVSGEWITEAQFVVDLKEKADDEDETDTEPPTTTPEEEETEPLTTTTEEENTETQAETTDEDTETKEPDTTRDKQKGSDKKAKLVAQIIAATGVAVIAAGTTFYFKKRKK